MKKSLDRLYYVDWLRSGAMFLLLFYHTGRFFDMPGWHIKNAEFSFAIEVFNRFLDFWHMPLFFFLAGASVWFALETRTPRGFAGERLLRLFIPLVFGMLIIVPPQVYLERIFDGDFSGSFFSWYPSVFSSGAYPEGNLSWHHLWFLAYLFTFSLLLLALFRYFKDNKRQALITGIAGFLKKPGAIFLPAIPLIIYDLALRPIYGYGNQNLIDDWANFLFYITVFFYGFLLMSDRDIIRVVQRNRFISLAMGVVLSLAIYLIETETFALAETTGDIIVLIVRAIACWGWLLAIIGFGSLLLNFGNRALKYASDAVLPVYILHQTVIIALGFFVIQWDMAIAPKYFFIVVFTLASCLIIYEAGKRVNVTRFLFGMKLKKQND